MKMCENCKNWIVSISWKDVLADLSLLLLFAIAPTLFLFIAALITSRFNDVLQNCYLSGEFVLYADALLASAFVIVRTTRAQWPFYAVALMLVTVCYVIITFVLEFENADHINKRAIFVISAICFCISIVLLFFALCSQHRSVDARVTNKIKQKSIKSNLK
ncbi:MAG: hypothetical protein MJZ79_00115 [Paludibacteraceae bacterium]|nr:hypothetical protein [Paludibacteraceae bacterium]